MSKIYNIEDLGISEELFDLIFNSIDEESEEDERNTKEDNI